jgi:aryl carrier-like protein
LLLPLSQQDLERVGEYVRSHLSEWLSSDVLDQQANMVRIQEELRNQRELMTAGFDKTDVRFQDLIHQFDKRFEQIDKRFEQVDKRLSFQQWLVGGGVVLIAALMTLYQFLA